jgi:hypothetical protein
MTSIPTTDEIRQALAAQFAVEEVKVKPQAFSKDKTKAMAVWYIDARTVMERLESVVGLAGWQDEYECLPDGGVACRLRVKLGGEWVLHTDVGSPSEQEDEGDRRKAAFSDALKRAAVKFGVGRYLYRLPRQWVDYDLTKKQFVRTPKLPAWAAPQPTGAVSGDQLAELERLLKASAADRKKFLAAYGIKELANLPADCYGKAVGQLQKKIDGKASVVTASAKRL